jgi:Ankyrin repeats (many copies)
VNHFVCVILAQNFNRFQYAFCQLEILQDCRPKSIQRTLDKLPKSLDETYDRILKEIKEPNREDAHRLLQCVVTATRPLRVEELAEVLAVDFDDAEGIPKLNPTWRWEDQEQALLDACSSLIVIVKSGQFRVVKFSHFSVKEFLTSPGLATSSEHGMHYHIAPEPAHTILAQACMGVLLRPDDHSEQNGIGIGNCSPLAGYAAEHWVAHAQFERVSSYLRNSMKCLFDPDKPYFAAWCRLYDIDTPPPTDSTSFMFTLLKPGASPLYYAALCGFQDLVKHLIIKYPQHVNASGGYYVTPLLAAMAGEHFQTANILRDNGAHLDVWGSDRTTPLHSAAYFGHFRMVQVLLDYEADVNARNANGDTPLHYACQSASSRPNLSQLLDDVARLLLEHEAGVNARSHDHFTPLHLAAHYGRVEAVRLLLKHGADVGAEDEEGRTPLSLASLRGHDVIINLLSSGVPGPASGREAEPG